jgi:hypothetical protein
MWMDGFVDLEYAKYSLGQEDSTKYDDSISFLLDPFTQVVFASLGLDELTFDSLKEEQKTILKEAVCAYMGCQIYRKDPKFGQKTESWKVGNVSKAFQKRRKNDPMGWCEYYDITITLAERMITPTYLGSGKRQGLEDEYNRPY